MQCDCATPYLTGLGEDAETVVLRVIGDIRGAASVEDLPAEFAGGRVWTITPHEQAPSRDVLRTSASLDNFAHRHTPR